MKIATNIKIEDVPAITIENLQPGTLFKRKYDGNIGIRLKDSYVILSETPFAKDRPNRVTADLPGGSEEVEILPAGSTFTFTQD